MDLLSQLNKCPPTLARLLAPCGTTNAQLAARTGLSVPTIERLSRQKDWAKQLAIASAFLDACGIKVIVAIPTLHAVQRAIESGKGLKALRQLRRTSKTPLWVRAQQAKHIRRLVRNE